MSLVKQLVYNVNTNTGIIKLADNQPKINLFEYENNAVNLIFNFDKNINKDDKLIILFINNNGSRPYTMVRKSNVQFTIEIPRAVLCKGLLGFTIQQYDEGNYLAKYVLDNYLVVNTAGDITEAIVENNPDLLAEILFRIQQLEKKG